MKMESYELAKKRGLSHSNPDRKANWKKWFVKKPCSNYVKANKKDLHVSQRRSLKDWANDEEKIGHLPVRKFTETTYLDNKTKKNTLLERQVKRSRRYCIECGRKHCEHRAFESAMIIVNSRKHRNGDFAIFPKEIALMIAEKVYEAQMAYLYVFNGSVVIPRSLYREVYIES